MEGILEEGEVVKGISDKGGAVEGIPDEGGAVESIQSMLRQRTMFLVEVVLHPD